MKNFSQITDTKQHLDLKVTVKPLIDNGPPCTRICLCDTTVFDGTLDQTVTVHKTIGLYDDILVHIELNDKIYDIARETAISIMSITIDDLEIKDHCYDLIEYTNDQNNHTQTLYLGFNGQWKLRIPGPFFRWWHGITGQGWLLSGARSKSQSYAASLTSTNDDLDHSDV